MKYKATHPILVNGVPKGFRSRHLVGCSIQTEFEIDRHADSESAFLALSYTVPGAKGSPGHVHQLYTAGENLYTPVLSKDNLNVGPHHPSMVSAFISSACADAVLAEAGAANNKEHQGKLYLTTKGGVVNRASKVTAKDLLHQPPIDIMDTASLDLTALSAASDKLRAMVLREFVVIDNQLCRLAREPFFAVVLVNNRFGMTDGRRCRLELATDAVPNGMAAAFRLGRLSDAIAFMQTINADTAPDPQCLPPDIREHGDFRSSFDDVGLTVSNASAQALMSFGSSFGHEYIARQEIDRLLFNTPLEQIGLARRLRDQIDDRGIFAAAADAATLAETLEEIASLGSLTPFASRMRIDGGESILSLIVDMWNNQSIDVQITQEPTCMRASR